MSNHKKPEDTNTGIHLSRIIDLVPCRRHDVEAGQACWNLSSARGPLRAICDRRARDGGANGDITQDEKHKNAPIYKKKEYSR